MPVFAQFFAGRPDPVATPVEVSEEVREFVQDDFQETVWYDGVLPCDPPDVLAQYWGEFVADCATWGRHVPEGLNPDVYYQVWMEEYRYRTAADAASQDDDTADE